jgi:hypothetical protein
LTAPAQTIDSAFGWSTPQIYGGYIWPQSVLDDPTGMKFSVRQWNTSTNDPYHVMLFEGTVATGFAPVEREHVSWLDDDPVHITADELGRHGVATALEAQLPTLVADHPRRSFLIHIDGPWGAGKSTLMRFVQERVAGTRDGPGTWLVVSYNAWRQSKAGPPSLTLLETIRSAVRADKGTPVARVSMWLRERARLVARWQWIAAAVIVAALVSVAAYFLYTTAGFTLTKWGDVAKLAGGLLPTIAAAWVFAGSVERSRPWTPTARRKRSWTAAPTRWKTWRGTFGGYWPKRAGR